jgi:hypothetical protein
MHISCTKDSREQQKMLLQINDSNICDQRVPDLIQNNLFLTSSKKSENVLCCVIIENTGLW